MDRAAVVRGVAKWFGDTILPRLVSYGATRLMAASAVRLAETRPELAEKLLLGKLPPVAASMLDAVSEDGAAFEAVVEAMRGAVHTDGLRFSVPEVGLAGIPPHEFTIDAAEFDRIVSAIRTAGANAAV